MIRTMRMWAVGAGVVVSFFLTAYAIGADGAQASTSTAYHPMQGHFTSASISAYRCANGPDVNTGTFKYPAKLYG